MQQVFFSVNFSLPGSNLRDQMEGSTMLPLVQDCVIIRGVKYRSRPRIFGGGGSTHGRYFSDFSISVAPIDELGEISLQNINVKFLWTLSKGGGGGVLDVIRSRDLYLLLYEADDWAI